MVAARRRTIKISYCEEHFFNVPMTLHPGLPRKLVIALAIMVIVLFSRWAMGEIQDNEVIPALEDTASLF